MESSSIQPADVHTALRALRRSGAVPQDPLLELVSVEQRLAALEIEPTRDNREWALSALLVEIVSAELSRARGGALVALASGGLSPRESAACQLAADFSAGNLEREAWSALYYRYLTPHPLKVQRLAHLTQPGGHSGTRQIARRVERGVVLLAAALRRVEVQARVAAPPESPGDRRLAATTNNLPHRASRFVGRMAAIRRLKADIAEHRAVTLIGLGGVGKTRLAIRTAAEVVDAFDAGVWFVDLSGLTDPGLVPGAVAQAVNVGIPADRDIVEALVAALGSRRLLLVIDNAEHVLEACADLVGRLVVACEGLHVLTTSREALVIEHEVVRPVPPLAVVPYDAPATTAGIGAFEAVQLLVDRIQAVDPEFELTDVNAGLVAEIVRRLEGIPLAIELAAAWALALPLSAIVSQLHDPLAALTRGARSAPDRQKTLRGAIRWSYELLAPGERELMANLSVLPGGWDMEAVLGMCAVDGASAHDVTTAHARLIAKSLVVADLDGPLPRFRFYEPVRLFAADALSALGGTAGMQRRHAAYFVAFAERTDAAQLAADQTAWYARLDLDHNNIRAALRWCLDQRATDWAQRIAVAIWGYWFERGFLAEGRAWLAEVLEQYDREQATMAEARLLHAAGSLAIYQADYSATRLLLEKSIRISESLGDEPMATRSMVNLAHVVLLRGELAEARRLYEAYLALVRRAGGDARAEPVILCSLAEAMTLQGDWHGARALLREALDLSLSVGDALNAAEALSHLGTSEIVVSGSRAAEQLLHAALTEQVRLGDSTGMAQTLRDLGIIAYLDGRFDRAEELLKRSLALSTEQGNSWGIGETQLALGRCAFERGNVEVCRKLLVESLNIAQRIDNPLGLASARQALGEVAMRTGALAGARDLLLSALDAQARCGAWAELLATLGYLAVLARRQRRFATAHTMVAAISSHIVNSRSVWLPRALGRATAAARAALGSDEAARAWEEGARMPLAEAAAWAADALAHKPAR